MSAIDQPAPQKAQRIVPVPTLRCTTGTASGTAIRIDQEEGTLGRREDNTYVLADPQVSRVHARLSKRGGSVIVADLGSSGGTKLNGEKLEGPFVVNHGDTISFGTAECRFEDPAAAANNEAPTMVFEVPEIETGPSLSPRQQQVLELIAEGMTNSEIGDQLGITERTVKAYAQELYDKLGTRNRAGAVAEGVKNGLL
ncbi:MAG: LuxR C-terminal-related transcriptional regulator [Actinobacteria bacterium]|nr:LuxR C-terminal-related transcriptional regulator [Actinomycetota bacterium]